MRLCFAPNGFPPQELDDHPECPLCGTVVQRVQRYATYGRLKQTVLKTVAHEIIEGGTLKSLSTALPPLLSVSLSQPGGGLRAAFLPQGSCRICSRQLM